MLEDLSGDMQIKIKKLKPCEDCGTKIRLNAKRCIPCSETNRLEKAKSYAKSNK